MLWCCAAYWCFWISITDLHPSEGPGIVILRAAIYLAVGPLLVAGAFAAGKACEAYEDYLIRRAIRRYQEASR